MRVTHVFEAYNKRRYGKPWIHKIVEWPIGKKPSIVEWGTYLGTEAGGIVEIEAESGDVVRLGQKDHHGPDSTAGYYIVRNNRLKSVSAPEAKRHFVKRLNKQVKRDLAAMDQDDQKAFDDITEQVKAKFGEEGVALLDAQAEVTKQELGIC